MPSFLLICYVYGYISVSCCVCSPGHITITIKGSGGSGGGISAGAIVGIVLSLIVLLVVAVVVSVWFVRRRRRKAVFSGYGLLSKGLDDHTTEDDDDPPISLDS